MIENQKKLLNIIESVQDEIETAIDQHDNNIKPLLKRSINGEDPLDAEFVVVKIESFDVNSENDEHGILNLPDLNKTESHQINDL